MKCGTNGTKPEECLVEIAMEMKRNKDPKDCPFCGEEAEIVILEAADIEVARCPEMACPGYYAPNVVVALSLRGDIQRKLWNTRPMEDHLEARKDHAESWYACRFKKLREWVKGLQEEQRKEYFNIVANGKARVSDEPPTYELQFNLLRHRAEKAEKELEKAKILLRAFDSRYGSMCRGTNEYDSIFRALEKGE